MILPQNKASYIADSEIYLSDIQKQVSYGRHMRPISCKASYTILLLLNLSTRADSIINTKISSITSYTEGQTNPWPFEGTWWSAFRVKVSDLIWDRINCLVIWEWLTALFPNPESMNFDLESIIKQNNHCRPFSCFTGKYSYSVSLSKAKTGH